MNVDFDNIIPRSKLLRFFYGILASCLVGVVMIAPSYVLRDSIAHAYLFSVYMFLPLMIGIASAFIFGYHEEKPSASLINVLYALLCLIVGFIASVALFRTNLYAAALFILYSPVSIFMTAIGTLISDHILVRNQEKAQ